MKRLRPREAQSPRLHGEFISSARMDQDAAVLIPAHASVGHQRNLGFPPDSSKTKGGGGWVAQVGGGSPWLVTSWLEVSGLSLSITECVVLPL